MDCVNPRADNYFINDKYTARGEAYLAAYHSHFILVDDGTSGYEKELALRAKLEQALSSIMLT